jgi:hypothetical protein
MKMQPEDQPLKAHFAEADARLANETGHVAAFVRQLLGRAQMAASRAMTPESIPRLPLSQIAIEVLSNLSLSPDQGLMLPAFFAETQRRMERLDPADEKDLRSFLSLPDVVPPLGVSQVFSSIMQRILEEVMGVAAIAMAEGQGN